MKLDNRTEIKFIGTAGTITSFALVLEDHITMRIFCDIAEAEPIIRIAGPEGANPLPTNGRFQTTAKLLEEPDGSPLGTEIRVDRKSVYKYVLPRVHILMGRLLRAA